MFLNIESSTIPIIIFYVSDSSEKVRSTLIFPAFLLASKRERVNPSSAYLDLTIIIIFRLISSACYCAFRALSNNEWKEKGETRYESRQPVPRKVFIDHPRPRVFLNGNMPRIRPKKPPSFLLLNVCRC